MKNKDLEKRIIILGTVTPAKPSKALLKAIKVMEAYRTEFPK